MKLNLIFGIALLSCFGLSYALGLNSLDITLQVEARQKKETRTLSAISPGCPELPADSSNNLSGTLQLSLSADDTALGFYFDGLKRWLKVAIDEKGGSSLDYGANWKRRSL